MLYISTFHFPEITVSLKVYTLSVQRQFAVFQTKHHARILFLWRTDFPNVYFHLFGVLVILSFILRKLSVVDDLLSLTKMSLLSTPRK